MQDEHKDETQRHTGFEYLGPQSEHADNIRNLPRLPSRNRQYTVNPAPVEGEERPEKFGNVDFHFTWPDLKPTDRPDDDEWAGKDYQHPGSSA
jgi:hypothetical protein